MGSQLKVLLLNKWWPFTIGHYFLRALQRRSDVDLKTCGSFSGAYIPWRNGMVLPDKYVYTPDIPLPYAMERQDVDYDLVKAYLGDWIPDLIINTSSTCFWREKPSDGYSTAIAIDPHVLDYDPARKASDKFFNMQLVYSKPGDIYLPYAYDPTLHYEDVNVKKIYDVAMVGLEYPHRMALAAELEKRGLKVHIGIGDVFDDYRKVNNQAHIVLNWSTLDDLNARAFEAPMLGIPVMNWCTDMQHFDFFQRIQTFPCDNNGDNKSKFISGAVEKAMWVMDNMHSARQFTDFARMDMQGERYDDRIQQILDMCGFGE